MMTTTDAESAAEVQLPPSPSNELHHTARDTLTSPTASSISRPKSAPRPTSIDSTTSISPGSLTRPSLRPRDQSPTSRGQLRSHTSSEMVTLPPMQRAHSSPGVDSSGRFVPPSAPGTLRPASPLDRSARRSSPLRTAVEETYSLGATWGRYIEPNIPEHAELNIVTSCPQPPSSIQDGEHGAISFPTAYNTIPRSRRTTSSLLYRSASPANLSKPASPTLGGHSPFLTAQAQSFANEPYPFPHAYSYGSGSSMSSTPTSFRSRSPSISSLETIPDIPDAEEPAQTEEGEYATSRSAGGESEDGDGRDSKRRNSLERFAGKEKRKRWSVCGAERRGDFSLEVIEE